MSEARNKIFVFTQKSTDRILAVKRSRDLDFTIPGLDWHCHELVSSADLPAKADADLAWDPTRGLRTLDAVSETDRIVARLLRKKLEILISMRAGLHVMTLQIKPQLSPARLLSVPVDRRHFAKMFLLVTRERRLLKKRMKSFFEEFQARIEGAETIEKLDSEYQDIMNNVTLGGYAAVSRDLEESHVKRIDS